MTGFLDDAIGIRVQSCPFMLELRFYDQEMVSVESEKIISRWESIPRAFETQAAVVSKILPNVVMNRTLDPVLVKEIFNDLNRIVVTAGVTDGHVINHRQCRFQTSFDNPTLVANDHDQANKRLADSLL